MLKGKIPEAVKFLWKTCIKLKQNPELINLTFEAKEEFLFLLLLKTFMESEDASNNPKETIDELQSAAKDKEKEEIEARKRLVRYLTVRMLNFDF